MQNRDFETFLSVSNIVLKKWYGLNVKKTALQQQQKRKKEKHNDKAISHKYTIKKL